MNKDDFTVLVSGGTRCCWVSMCTMWLSHSKWLSKYGNRSASNLVLILNIPLWKLFRWFRRPQLWSTGDWQLHHDNTPAYAWSLVHSVLQNIKSPRWLNLFPLQLRFGALWLLAFPKAKITFESKEISDCWWDSGKYDWAAHGDWENCVRSQGAYFEGDWGIVVLCTIFLASCIFFSKCLYFSYCAAEYFLDRPCIVKCEDRAQDTFWLQPSPWPWTEHCSNRAVSASRNEMHVQVFLFLQL